MSAELESKPTYSPYDPVQLGQYVNHALQKEGRRNFVTFLLGAGCSRSAGIPLAGEIVRELREEAKVHPLLMNVGEPPAGVSEYGYLMEKLGSPRERAQRVKKYVDRANDANGRLKINWTHLLLAAMVEKGCVNRILTTNFDPLIVEALAVTGQPIRTYDLNTTGKYNPGTLDHAAVIYLHGQMHSLFLANAPGEMERLKGLYPSVLQEAVQDSLLIVLGYSGDCDPVLDSLVRLPNFPCGLWWSHYSPSGSQPGTGFDRIAAKHGADCHLALGCDSDNFMRKLVVDGMKLDLPDEVMKPFAAARINLERITAFPTLDAKESDPVQSAIELLRQAEAQSVASSSPVVAVGTTMEKPAKPIRLKLRLDGLSLIIQIQMAVLTKKWQEFDHLIAEVPPDPASPLSRVIGDGFVRRADDSRGKGQLDEAFQFLAMAEKFGLTEDMKPWQLTVIGAALSARGKVQGNTPEADRLFAEAALKNAEAVRIKPDMHEAFFNWGNSLLDQARLKGNTAQADRLFNEAAQKYGEAVQIKPDKYEAFYNWGIALSVQAKLKGNTPEASQLFADAALKFAEAMRFKPDMAEALSNWSGALSDRARLEGNTPEAERLFGEAALKAAEAVRMKPDNYQAFNNWGNALSAQARFKGNTPDAEHLFAEAEQKYAEAMRIKPDGYETLNNWGTALLNLAKAKGNPPEADRLLAKAGQKYAEAVQIKPDFDSVHFNIGCLASLHGEARQCCEALTKWKKHAAQPKKAQLDEESDFDKVRSNPEFRAFRATLSD